MLGSDLPQHLSISAPPGEVGNEVSKQCCDAGRHPWAPLSPSLHTAHSSPADGSAQPLRSIGVTQGSVVPARLWHRLEGQTRPGTLVLYGISGLETSVRFYRGRNSVVVVEHMQWSLF